MNTLIKILTAFLLSIFISTHAQEKPVDSTLTNQQIEAAVDSLSRALKQVYVFPDMAIKMADHISAQQKKGVYAGLGNGRKVAEQLTADLQSVSKDKHLNVRFNPERIAQYMSVASPEDSVARRERWVGEMRSQNFGFHKISVLEGNIGYLDLRAFMNPEFAGETAAAAMNFLANADALIIDLRRNGGGSPGMIQLLTSYLYDSDPVHLNNFYWRPTDTRTQTWTLPYVPGKRRPDIPVYVLTSSDTFSAAEEFTYNLKNLERATVIGETTGGGAHPGGPYPLDENLVVFIPSGRAINPVTQSNWEGTGVKPHIEVPSDEALKVAVTKAVENLMTGSDNDGERRYYEQLLLDLKSGKLDIKG
ncbi:S41 family peptidase [Robertkochia flava]|uniref:S41 family peptidase n=1 Tax=Robertkochia flava TaxID=3447986 RepID=UPI001CCB285A|nr:S41 family peptidase [Robertkochia marina]